MRPILNLRSILRQFVITSYMLFLFALMTGNLVAAIYSILPSAVVGWGATEPSYLGYVSHCSFAPWSTLISLALVAVGIFMFAKLIKYFRKRRISFRDILEYSITTTLLIFAFVMFFPITISVIIAYVLYKIHKSHKLRIDNMSYNTTEIQN